MSDNSLLRILRGQEVNLHDVDPGLHRVRVCIGWGAGLCLLYRQPRYRRRLDNSLGKQTNFTGRLGFTRSRPSLTERPQKGISFNNNGGVAQR